MLSDQCGVATTEHTLGYLPKKNPPVATQKSEKRILLASISPSPSQLPSSAQMLEAVTFFEEIIRKPKLDGEKRFCYIFSTVSVCSVEKDEIP